MKWKTQILFANDAGAGGAGGGAGTGGAAGGAGAAGAGGGAAGGGAGGQGSAGGGQAAAGSGAAGGSAPPAAPTAYYPEKLPDHFRGPTDRETIDRMFQSWSGLREEMSKRGTVPKTPDGYKLELDEQAARVYGDLSKDPRTKVFTALAQKYELTDKQASGFFRDFNAQLIADGLVKTINVDAEARALLGDQAISGKSADQVRQEAGQRWKAATDFLDVLVAGKQMTKEAAAILKRSAETADGVRAVEQLQSLLKPVVGLQPGGETGGKGLTKDDLDRMANDPRNDPRHPTYSPEFVKQTQDAYKRFFAN